MSLTLCLHKDRLFTSVQVLHTIYLLDKYLGDDDDDDDNDTETSHTVLAIQLLDFCMKTLTYIHNRYIH